MAAAASHSASDLVQALLESATPNIYRRNAFRVTGLPVDVSERDVARHIEELKMAERLGTPVHAPAQPFPLSPAPDTFASREAAQRIRQANTRFVDAFFWFWPLSSGDGPDPAIELLSKGLPSDAERLWGQASGSVAQHNLAVLHHLRVLEIESQASGEAKPRPERDPLRQSLWVQALHSWAALLGTADFWTSLPGVLRAACGLQVALADVSSLRDLLPDALTHINASLAVAALRAGNTSEARRQKQLVVQSGLPATAVRTAFREAASPLAVSLEARVERASQEFKSSPTQGVKIATSLMSDTRGQISGLAALLDDDDPLLTASGSGLAESVRAGLVRYANATKDWASTAKLLEQAVELPCSVVVREAVTSDLRTVRGNLVGQRIENILSETSDPYTQMNRFMSEILPLLSGSRNRGDLDEDFIDNISGMIRNLSIACANGGDFVAARRGLVAARDLARTAEARGEAALALSQLNSIEQQRAAERAQSARSYFFVGACVVVALIWAASTDSCDSRARTSASSPQQVPTPMQNYTTAPQWSPPVVRADSGRQALKEDIERIQAIVDTYEAQLPAMVDELKALEAELESSNRSIEYRKTLAYDPDLDVEIDRHNALVSKYNAKLALYQRKYSDYERLIADGNEKIKQYNTWSR